MKLAFYDSQEQMAATGDIRSDENAMHLKQNMCQSNGHILSKKNIIRIQTNSQMKWKPTTIIKSVQCITTYNTQHMKICCMCVHKIQDSMGLSI